MVTLTNKLGLPQPLVDAIANDGYSKGDSDFSVTELIAPPQQRMLLQKHADEVTEDAADRIWALLGQTVHAILERANATGIAERRLYASIDGARISGQFDHMDIYETPDEGIILRDWKLASVWEYQFGLKAERELQLNALAHLARLNGHHVDKIEAVMIFRDWQKSKAAHSTADEYPQAQVARIPVEMWEPTRIQQYLTDRIRLHRDAWKYQTECSDEERWAKPPKYALRKEGRKTAIRVLDSEEAVLEYAADHKAAFRSKDRFGAPNIQLMRGFSVEFRPGENTRCALYCAALPFCAQGKALVGAPVTEDGDD